VVLMVSAFALVACLQRKSGTLEVHVLDADSLYGLSEARVYFGKHSGVDSVYQARDGLATIEDIKAQVDTLYISKYGYHRMSLLIEIKAGSKTVVEARLKSYTPDKRLVKWVCGPPTDPPADYVATHTAISYAPEPR